MLATIALFISLSMAGEPPLAPCSKVIVSCSERINADTCNMMRAVATSQYYASVEFQGSAPQPYILKNVGGVYSCSCPSWRNQCD